MEELIKKCNNLLVKYGADASVDNTTDLLKEFEELSIKFGKYVISNDVVDYNPKYDDFLIRENCENLPISGSELFSKFVEENYNGK